MASNTPNLGLYKKNPATDGNDTFNIQTMLNENWDRIDSLAGPGRTTETVKGVADALARHEAEFEELKGFLNYMPVDGGEFDGNDPGPSFDGGTF